MGIFQSIFLYPIVIPIDSVVMFFQVMLSEYGFFNRILYQLGFSEIDWLESGAAFGVLLFLYIWKNGGYNIVLFLTGLNSIPKEYEDAAKLDGAGKWQYFRYVQCPLLIPSFLFVLVISVINSFKCYREAYLLGGRYPDDSIYMLQHFMNNNFESLNYQRLSVAALLVFLVIFALVIFLFFIKFRLSEVIQMKNKTIILAASILILCSYVPAGAEERVSVSLSEDQLEYYAEGLGEFQSLYPEVTLEVESYSMNDLMSSSERIKTQLMSGKGPDLLLLNSYGADDVYKIMKAGVFAPLDEYMTEENGWQEKEYVETVIEGADLPEANILCP